MRMILLAAILLFGASTITAQTMNRYAASHKKALPIGTRVWVNLGDNPCMYNDTGRPSTKRHCYRRHDYARAVVVGTDKVGSYYVYTVKFKTPNGHPINYNGAFDGLWESTAPTPGSRYSRYYLALNW